MHMAYCLAVAVQYYQWLPALEYITADSQVCLMTPPQIHLSCHHLLYCCRFPGMGQLTFSSADLASTADTVLAMSSRVYATMTPMIVSHVDTRMQHCIS